MTNIIEPNASDSLERLLEDVGAELQKQGEPPECIDYVLSAISGAYHRHAMADVMVIQESEIGLAVPLKRKVGALWGELIVAYVDLWHCGGGSKDYGDTGPGRNQPAEKARIPDKKARVIPLYKNDREVKDD